MPDRLVGRRRAKNAQVAMGNCPQFAGILRTQW